jgi:hypothetical protein
MPLGDAVRTCQWEAEHVSGRDRQNMSLGDHVSGGGCRTCLNEMWAGHVSWGDSQNMSMGEVYITNQFQTTFAGGGGG